MIRWGVVIALLLLGCSRSDLDDVTADSSPEGGSLDDAAPTRSCDPSKPFSAPIPLPGDAVNGHGTAFDFRLTPDELHGYFASNRDGQWSYSTDLYEVTRATRDGTFMSATRQFLSTSPNDVVFFPSASSDALTLYFVGTLPGLDATRFEPRVATRAQASGVFAGEAPLPMPLPPLTTVNDLYVLPDGLVAYFLQDGAPRLFGIAVTRRPAVSMLFGPPELLIPDTGPKVFDSPVVTPDELTMFLGGEDAYPEHIHVATRARVDEPFSDPVPVHELDSSGGESPSWISPDGCRLYFTRNVLEAGTTARVYVASRPAK